jgi:DNA-binding MarR family transcriptional regulator
MSTIARYRGDVTRPTSPLQREIKQTRPFRSPGHEAVLSVGRTADVLRRRFAALLEPSGVTPQQYNVLRILRGAGTAGLPTLEIAERMIEQAPGITRLIDRLERRAWVRRERGTEDRRQVQCHVTAAGLKLLAHLDPIVDASEVATVAMLTAAEQRQLIALLDRVRGGP